MSNTARYGLPLLAVGQSGKEITVNGGQTLVDALVNLTPRSATTAAPPASPAIGDVYLVPPGATGWTGATAGEIAVYVSKWTFIEPILGMRAFVQDSPGLLIYSGAAWVKYLGTQQNGWTPGTGSTNAPNKGAMDYDGATTATLAARLNAIEQALLAHGLIST